MQNIVDNPIPQDLVDKCGKRKKHPYAAIKD